MQRTYLEVATLTLTVCLTACGGDGGTSTDTTTGSTGDASEVTTNEPATTPATNPTGEAPTTDTPTMASTTALSATDATTTDTPDDTTGAVVSTGHGSTMVEMTTEPPPSCEDGQHNQDETDVDCGGTTCAPCADGLACVADQDCQVASCVLGVCAAATCADGVKNAEETDVDCGGATCEPCADNLACADAGDCVSQVCTDALCTPASCSDAVLNGEETDLDCGGPVCDGCFGDAMCIENSDCLSEGCVGGLCADVGCQNDTDCDMLDSLCAEGHCKIPGFQCEALPKNNGMACEGNELCVENTKCEAGTCGGGTPKNCSAMSDACHVGSCDVGTGECISNETPDGVKCEDGNACTKLETCKAGVCGGPLTALFTEDFSDNMAGWTLGTQWAIGPTKASVGCSNGQDPALDHSASDDNGVAGVVLGGCIPDKSIHDYYCLTSPVIDLTTAPADVHLSFWRWLVSDYTPYMKNTVDVFNGTNWVTVFETLGSPAVADKAWTFVSYDVTPHKNDKFQARMCFNVGSTIVFSVPSWSVDDVTIGPAACMQ